MEESETQSNRKPPEVIHIRKPPNLEMPKPKRKKLRWPTLFFPAWMLTIIVVPILGQLGVAMPEWSGFAYIALLIFGGIGALLLLRHSRRQDEQRREKIIMRMQKRMIKTGTPTLIAKISAASYYPTKQNNFTHIFPTLHEHPRSPEAGARIAVIFDGDIPEISDYRREPIIISPTDFSSFWLRRDWQGGLIFIIIAIIAWQLDWCVIPIFCVAIFMILFIIFRQLPTLIKYPFGQTYTRIASGIVQRIQTSPFRKTQHITQFPLDEHTTIVATHSGYSGEIEIAQHENRHRFFIGEAKQFIDVLRLLLSTAPTPPLSDEHLVG